MNAENSISREEHEEFKKRIEDENHRQNRRLDLLEKNIQEIGNIAMSVEKNGCKPTKHGERAGAAGEAPGSTRKQGWRNVAQDYKLHNNSRCGADYRLHI